MNEDCQIIILAGGQGSRMASSVPKVMHKVGGEPMLSRVINNAKLVTEDVILVYSEHLKPYLTPYQDLCKLIIQKNPKGTADAVASCGDMLDKDKFILVLFGDNPFISPEIIKKLLNHSIETNSAAAILVFKAQDPAEYGRIITDKDGIFLKILEFKFASPKEREINLCNSGIMAFAPGIIQKYLKECLKTGEDENKEHYLTDMIEVCSQHKEKVTYLLCEDKDLLIGVNTKEELEAANNIYANIKL